MDSKYIAPIAGTLLGALGAFNEPIQALIMAHPAYASIFGGLAVVLAAFAKQPQK